MAVYEVDVVQYWIILDFADPHREWGQAFDTVVFADAPAGWVLHGSVVDTLAFLDTGYASGDQARAVADTLAFTQGAVHTRVGYVYQNFPITQSAAAGHGAGGGQTLAFADTASMVRVRCPGGDTLAFVETTFLGATRPRAVGDTLAFDDFAVIFSPNASFIAIPLPPVAIAPTVTLGPLTLPAPDFGNTEELGQTRVSRNSMGGTFIIYQASYWPTTDEFTVTFSYLNQTICEALRTYVTANVGMLVPYTDHEGNPWTVIITTPEVEVTQAGHPTSPRP